MKKLTYTYEQITTVVNLLNDLEVRKGLSNNRIMTAIATIIDEGVESEDMEGNVNEVGENCGDSHKGEGETVHSGENNGMD